jgi:MFS family permease
LLHALREVGRNRSLLVVLVVNVVVTLTALNMNVVVTSVATLGYGADASQLGLLHALSAVGAVLAGYVLTRVDRIRAATLGPACLILSAALALNAAAPSLVWFTLAGPLLGIGIGVYQGVLQSAAQAAAPPEMLGRVMSLVTLGSYGLLPVGALTFGAMIDATFAQLPLWIGASTTAAAGAAVLVLFRARSR